MSRTQGSEHGNAFPRSAAHILIADDGCGGCVALRSGRTRAPLVGESGGSWSDCGVVGSRRGMASMFFSFTEANIQLKQKMMLFQIQHTV